MPAITLANFAVYVAQISTLAVVGVVLPRVLGPASPRARLVHYRAVLVVALLLPLAFPSPSPAPSGSPAWLRAIGAGVPLAPALAGAGHPPSAPTAVPVRPSALVRPAGPVALAAVVIGLVGRLLWVVVGLQRLHGLRRRAARLEPRPTPIREAVALVGADADIRLSREIASPVNFGARRPTILLPGAAQAYPDEEQRAIACHELIHVRRYDWLRTVGDEILRAIFWFHPAVWWLLDEIHLAREQVVDQEVVELTRSRRSYLEALVKLARPGPRHALRPASSFLRRAHLARRVAFLLKEVRMSRIHLVSRLVATMSMVLAVAALGVSVLPLQATPAEACGNGMAAIAAAPIQTAPTAAKTPQAGSATPKRQPPPKIVKRVPPVYPPEAKAKGIRGVVIVQACIDTTGHVSDIKVLRSIPALDQAAIDAVKQWQFQPPSTEIVSVLTVPFDVDGRGGRRAAPPSAARETRVRAPKVVSSVKPEYPADAKARGIQGVVIVEARIDKTGQVTDVKILRSIPALDQAAIDAVRQWKFEPQPGETTTVLTVPFKLDAGGRKASAASSVVRPGLASPEVLSSVEPVYPPDAKARGIKGVVIVEADVDASGHVTDVKVLRSVDPSLDRAAVDAVRQWRYEPLPEAKPFIVSVAIRFPPRGEK